MRVKIILFSLAVLVMIGVGAAFGFRYYVSAPSSDSSASSFTIEKGQSVNQIGDGLEAKGLIRSSLAFRWFVRLSGFQGKIQAGLFQLPHNLSLKDVTFRLSRGTTDQKITTLEGWRVEEVAQYLDQNHIVSKEEFLDAASNNKYVYSFLPDYSGTSLDKPYRRLEGYLFPDTYDIAAQSSADTIINIMLKNFGNRVDDTLRQDATKTGLSLAQTITLASIVEREANTDKDRKIVAGILLKRLQTSGWKLESDVTVQFLVGKDGNWWPKDITADQLNIDSSYNTRKNDGLPPTPVDSPSLSSITAAANPQTSDYWFYLADKTGVVHYAKTIDEHNANVAKYLR